MIEENHAECQELLSKLLLKTQQGILLTNLCNAKGGSCHRNHQAARYKGAKEVYFHTGPSQTVEFIANQ